MGETTEITSSRRSFSSWIADHFVVVVAGLLALSAFSYALGTGLIWPHRVGAEDPFSDLGGAIMGLGGAPGDRFIMIDWLEHGTSEDIITLDSITPAETSDVWRVTDVAIGVRRPGEPFVTAGAYRLASDGDWASCEAQPIETRFPYEVQPGEEIMLVQVMELLREGTDRLPPAEVRFRRDGVRFASHPGMHLKVVVEKKTRPFNPEASWEYACDHPASDSY